MKRGGSVLKPKQKKCIEMLIEGELTQREVARELNVSEQTLCRWKHSEEFAAELKNANRLCIQALAPKATRVLGELLSSDSDNVRLGAVREVLDRSGFKSEEKIELNGTLVSEVTKLDELIKQMNEDDG